MVYVESGQGQMDSIVYRCWQIRTPYDESCIQLHSFSGWREAMTQRSQPLAAKTHVNLIPALVALGRTAIASELGANAMRYLPVAASQPPILPS